VVTVETPASPTTRGLRLGTAGLIGLIAALWGTPYLLIAVAVREVAPIVVVAARCATAAVVLLAIAGGMGVLRVERRHWPWVALLALLEFVVPFTLISIGEQSLPSSLTGILVASAPLLVAGLAPLFDHTEAPRGTRGLGLVAGFAGVVTVMGLDEPLGAATVIGLGLILVGSWLAARAGSPAPVPAARSVGGELSAACGDVQ